MVFATVFTSLPHGYQNIWTVHLVAALLIDAWLIHATLDACYHSEYIDMIY